MQLAEDNFLAPVYIYVVLVILSLLTSVFSLIHKDLSPSLPPSFQLRVKDHGHPGHLPSEEENPLNHGTLQLALLACYLPFMK